MLNSFIIRPAKPDDVGTIFYLIQALAQYEKLEHLMTGDKESLQQHLFGEKPLAEAVIADWQEKSVGFALFFPSYSTFLTKPGLYLEDLFVLPEYRRRGIGKGLLKHLIELAQQRQLGRLEWSVLDWNESAIKFYQSIGAEILPDWRICRLTAK